MAQYFGTDGIRGVANEELTAEIAFKAGNALAYLRDGATVVIGADTRVSGDMLMLALSTGLTVGGARAVYLGVMPTAGVAYLTRSLGADYGVVISASHNPKEYNGIKIFGADGYKLGDAREAEVESCFNKSKIVTPERAGKFQVLGDAEQSYADYLRSTVRVSLDGMKIALDCANGAAYRIAPALFRSLGAEVVCRGDEGDGMKINDGCGSLHPEGLIALVGESGADAGFAYDGDSDRLVAVDERGEIVDGDELLYALAMDYKRRGKLLPPKAVGTSHTNMGIQFAFEREGVEMLRSDIGDKYVMEMMKKTGSKVGGEQSGHIIMDDLSTTGDGILSSLQIAAIMKECGKKASELCTVKKFPQANLNVRVKDKVRALGSEKLAEKLEEERERLKGRGRIIVRASGTENVIRIFAETESREEADGAAGRIAETVAALEE